MTLLKTSRREHAIRDGVAVLKRLGDTASVYLPGVGDPVGPVNLQTYSNDLTQYNSNSGPSRAFGFLDPMNTMGAWRITGSATLGNSGYWKGAVPMVIGQTYTFAAHLKAVSGGNSVQIFVGGSAFSGGGGDRTLVVDISNGQLVSKSTEIYSWSATPSANGFWIIAGSFVASATNTPSLGAYVVLANQVMDYYSTGLFVGEHSAGKLLSTGGIAVTTTSPVAAQYKSWITGGSLNPSDVGLVGPANLLTYSGDFTQAGTSQQNVNITTNQADAYGGTTATLVNVASTVAWSGLGKASQTTVAGTNYTFAAIVKYGNVAKYRHNFFTGSGDVYVDFNPITGQAFNQAGANLGFSSASLGNGWWIYTITVAGQSTSSAYAQCRFSDDPPTVGQNFIVNRMGLFAGTYTADQLLAFGGIPLTTATAGATGQNVSSATKTILGPNLVSNYGNPFTSTTGYSNQNGGSASISGSDLMVTSITASNSARVEWTFPSNLTVGKTYQVTVRARLGTASVANAQVIGDASVGYAQLGIVSIVGTSDVVYNFQFTATSPGAYLQFITSATGTFYIGLASVQQIIASPNALWSNSFAGSFADSQPTSSAFVDSGVGLLSDANGYVGADITPQGTVWGNYNANINQTVYPIIATSTAASNYGLLINNKLVVGTTYRITVSWYGNNSQRAIKVDSDGFTNIGNSVSGIGSAIFKASNSTLFIYATGTGAIGESFGVYYVKTEVVNAKQATQATSGNRPILRRGIYNFSLFSNALDNAWWGKTNSSVSTGAAGPDGLSNAFGISDNTNNTSHVLNSSVVTITIGKTYTQAIVVKAGASNFVQVPFYTPSFGSVYANFDVTNGTVTASSGIVQASSVPVGNGYFLLSVSATCTSTQTGAAAYIWMIPSGNSAYVQGYAGTGAVQVYCSAMGAFEGVFTAQQVQACGGIPVTTSVGASSTKGNYGLNSSGGVKYLQSPVKTGQTGIVISGFTSSDLSYGVPIGNILGAQTQPGIGIKVRNDGGIWLRTVGTNQAMTDVTAPSVYSAGVPLVVSGTWNSPGNLRLRKNGVTLNTGVNNGDPTSTFGINLGTDGGGTTGEAFFGMLYPQIVINGAISDSDLLVLEKFVGALTGPTGVII